jgi:hypothetical protein
VTVPSSQPVPVRRKWPPMLDVSMHSSRTRALVTVCPASCEAGNSSMMCLVGLLSISRDGANPALVPGNAWKIVASLAMSALLTVPEPPPPPRDAARHGGFRCAGDSRQGRSGEVGRWLIDAPNQRGDRFASGPRSNRA